MKWPHLVLVEEEPEVFAPLFAAAAELGVRVGWLDLVSGFEVPAPLAAAASRGLRRAVLASAQGTLSFKARQGPAVLEDLVREHFLGFGLVLVRTHEARSSSEERLRSAPQLTDAASGLLLRGPDGREEELSSQELARRLRKHSLGPRGEAAEH